MMLPRRLGGGDEAYYTYVEEADNNGKRGVDKSSACDSGKLLIR